MQSDKSPIILNLVLVGVLAFAIYLGLMYMENQAKIKEELGTVEPVEKIEEPADADALPSVPSTPSAPKAPPAPLFIKDDIKKLLEVDASIKGALKDVKSFGFVIGSKGYTIQLNDGVLVDVVEGVQNSVSFTIKTDDSTFRKLKILVERENLLGIVQRLEEMQFDPPNTKKEILGKINSLQGFTSKLRSDGLLE